MKGKSPEGMMGSVRDSMELRTGLTLEAWEARVEQSGIDPLDQKAVRRWLKSEHGILQNSQWAIADAAARAAGWVRPGVEEAISRQYAGPKDGLRPVFDKLREMIEDFGDDVSIESRATYIPFVRRRQFVAIAAATRTRVDVGMRYTTAPRSKRLMPTRALGQSTHKIGLMGVDQIDGAVRRLLEATYDQNG